MAFVERRGKDRWRARYRGPDGRERSKTFTRKVDAERWLIGVEADRNRGQWVDPRLGRIALGEWAERWLGATVHLKPKTRAGYSSLLRTHVIPAFGTVELRALDTVAVREWVARLQAAGLSPSRIRQARQVLGAVLGAAVEAGYLPRNVAAGVRVPREQRREMLFLGAGEVDRLAEACERRAGGGGTLVYLLSYGGLRWGEAVALRRSRCDLLRSRINVDSSLAELGGELHFGDTKTHRARTVVMPAFLTERLAHQLAKTGSTDADPLVFATMTGRPLRNSNFSGRVFKPAVSEAGIAGELRIHDLRHTAAALLVAQGAHPKAIQAHLGHASITTTLDRYGHLFPTSFEILAQALEDTYQEARRNTPAASSRPERSK